MRAIAFGLGIALLLLLGCVAQGIGDIERFPEIKKVLDENPDANASVLFLNQEAVTLMIKEIRKACGQNMRIAPYWNVEIKAGKETWEFYIDGPAQNVVCEIKPDDVPPELMNDCRTGCECNDGQRRGCGAALGVRV